MQSWAKRGLQTALVTGGLLMLGTGIASADENVNPDTPAGPLDLNLTVPVDIASNAIGTPFGQFNLPGYHGELSTKPVTKPLKDVSKALDKPLNDVGKSLDKPMQGLGKPVSKVTDSLSALGKDHKQNKIADATSGSFNPTKHVAKGNKVSGDLTVPVQITGNALGVIGDAKVDNSHSSQSYAHNQNISTDGKNSGIAGNAVALDWALPVQISGNAGGVFGGSGRTSGSAEQNVKETGSITTNGSGSAASGNVVAGQFATPIQVTGNAVSSFLGNAYSDFDAKNNAEAGGFLNTSGKGGAGTGNVLGAPIALPVKLNGNAATAFGSDADSVSKSSANAKAGGKTTGLNNIPSYIQTNGDKSFVAGNIIQPQGGLIGNAAGNAAAFIGNSTTGNALGGDAKSETSGISASSAEAGGFSSTAAHDAAGSGNIADLPVALPVEAFGIGGTYIGNAHAAHDNLTNATAGDGTYTNGLGSFLSGNTATAQPASTAEVFGIGGSHIGNASGTAHEGKNIKSGGYNGTVGDKSSGSGNLVQVPLSVPAEVFGIGGSFVGQGSGTADETKVVTSGGGGNTEDDHGAASSNLVATPVSLPAQVFGIGGSFIGQGHGKASADTTSTAGGKYHATGVLGAVAGNLVQAPVSLPLQAHGVGGALAGIGTGEGKNLTDSKAGDDASTDGTAGALAGNLAQLPIGGAGSVFSDGAVLGGLASGKGSNDVVSTAGGDSATKGDAGAFAGNIISGEALPIASVFGDAASVGGVAQGDGTNVIGASSGGDTKTSGVAGAFSGDILDVPAAGVAQVFGDAASLAGNSQAHGDNGTLGKVGGTSATLGENKSVSGIDGQLPVGVVGQVFDVPLELLGNADASGANLTGVSTGEKESQLNLPIDGSALGANKLPNLNGLGGKSLGGDSLKGLTSLAKLPTLGGKPAQRADVAPERPTTLPLQVSSPLEDLVGGVLGDRVHTLPLPVVNGQRSALPVQDSPLDNVLGGGLLGSTGDVHTLPATVGTGQLPIVSSLPGVQEGQLVPQVELPTVTQVTPGQDKLGFLTRLLNTLGGKKFHTM